MMSIAGLFHSIFEAIDKKNKISDKIKNPGNKSKHLALCN